MWGHIRHICDLTHGWIDSETSVFNHVYCSRRRCFEVRFQQVTDFAFELKKEDHGCKNNTNKTE